MKTGWAVKYEGESGTNLTKYSSSGFSISPSSWSNLISGAAMDARNLDDVENCLRDALRACRRKDGFETIGRGE